MSIAVDICNTLANVNGQLAKEIKDYCFDKYPFPVPAKYFTSPAGMRVFRDAQPIPGTIEMLNSLAESFGGPVYVTTRPPEAEFITRRWLAKHGYPKGDILFCQYEEKISIYSSLAPHLIVEDDPRVLEKAKEELNILTLVPQWPYNRHIKGNRIVPVNWAGANEERAVAVWR